jgi:hypothetical protein
MSRSSRLRKLFPGVQGMFGFTWAITSPALAAAALTMSTEMPRLQRPCRSGGVTWIRATSRGISPLESSRGISDREMGV